MFSPLKLAELVKEKKGNLKFSPTSLGRLEKEKERMEKDIKVTELAPYAWILEKQTQNYPVKIFVDFRGPEREIRKTSYPIQMPLVYVLSPFVFQADLEKQWAPNKTAANIFTMVAPLIEYMKTPPVRKEASPAIQKVINVANSTEGPLWLVVGSYPGDITYGRTMYERPNIFFMDIQAASGPYANRSFQVNITLADQIAPVCQQLPNRFQKICFDWTVGRFFTPQLSIESQRNIYYVLKCFYEMLSDGGVLFISHPGALMDYHHRKVYNANKRKNVIENYNPSHPGDIFKEFVESVGFVTEEKKLDEIDDELVRLVHKEKSESGARSQNFLVCRKNVSGGKRSIRKRKTMRRKMNRKNLTKRR